MLNKILSSIIISSIFCFSISDAFAASTSNMLNVLVNVQIRGAINKPGIYKIPTGTRLVDVIYKAGGLRKDAVFTDINMTVPVTDGTSIYIASKKELEEPKKIETKLAANSLDKAQTKNKNTISNKPVKKQKTSSKQVKQSSLVNVNLATEEELNNLPGIGDTLAKNIISYRNKNGRFKDLSDLNNVNGIGDKKLRKLRSKITI